MSRILYISAANYNLKHLAYSKIGLENLWIFFLPKQLEPCFCQGQNADTNI